MGDRHTPGPWVTDEKDHDCPYQDINILAGRRKVCRIWIDDAPVHDYNAEQTANAHLISAAPELAWALRHALAPYEGKPDKACPNWVKPARAAIAKARGVQQ